MWKAKVTKIKEEFGITKFTVEYSTDNPSDTFTEKFQFTEAKGMAELKEIVKKKIVEITTTNTKPEKIKIGNIDLDDIVISKPQPTSDQIKRGEYSDKLEELQKKKRFVDLGVLDSKDIVGLQLEVKQLATELGEI